MSRFNIGEVVSVITEELKDFHRYQVGALAAFAQAAGTKLQHVKAHGIQYFMFEENLALGRASGEQVVELDPEIILMTMAMTKYNAEVRKMMDLPEVRDSFAKQGLEASTMLPAELGAYIKTESQKWAHVLKNAKVKKP